MSRKLSLKLLFGALLVLPLMLGTTLVAQADPEPPGGGEQIIGPPIDAVFTAISDADGFQAIATVVGACKKIPVAFGPTSLAVGVFANITAENIEDLRFRGIAPAGCFSQLGGEDLIVSGVTKFNNTGTALGADIQLSVVKPK